MSAECKKLRGPNDTGPDCGCRGDACALGRSAAKRQEFGHLVEHVSRQQHVCVLPGWFYRLRHDIGEGSVWECSCGQRWKWVYENWASGPEWRKA